MVCAVPFDSFDESQLGAFMESPLGVRAGISGTVLVWDETNEERFELFGALPGHWHQSRSGFNYLLDSGVAVDRVETWSGNIADYSLVFVCSPPGEPSWWPQLVNWTGRMYIAPNRSNFQSTAIYDNLLKDTEIRVITSVTVGSQTDGRFEVHEHPLTSGMVSVRIRSTVWRVLNGTTLYFYRKLDNIIGVSAITLSTQTVTTPTSRISYVVDGAVHFRRGISSIFDQATVLSLELWKPLMDNLLSVPV